MSIFAKIIEVDGNQLLVQKTFDEPEDIRADDDPNFCISFTTVREGLRIETKYFLKTEQARDGAFDHFGEQAAKDLLGKLLRVLEHPEEVFEL